MYGCRQGAEVDIGRRRIVFSRELRPRMSVTNYGQQLRSMVDEKRGEENRRGRRGNNRGRLMSAEQNQAADFRLLVLPPMVPFPV